MLPPPPTSTLFPYTTLFRSNYLDLHVAWHATKSLDVRGGIDNLFDRDPPIVTNPSLQGDRKSTRLNSGHVSISYAVFCLKKKKKHIKHIINEPYIQHIHITH